LTANAAACLVTSSHTHTLSLSFADFCFPGSEAVLVAVQVAVAGAVMAVAAVDEAVAMAVAVADEAVAMVGAVADGADGVVAVSTSP
jgi:hypothetical protein